MLATAAFLGALAIIGGLVARYYYGIDGATIGYFALMHTPLGQVLHNRELEKHKLTVHSKAAMHDAGSFLVRSIAYLEDNYAFLIIDKETGRTAVVDPGDPTRVAEHLKEVQGQWDYVHANSAALPAPEGGVQPPRTPGGAAGGAASSSASASASASSSSPSSSHPHSLLAQVRGRPELTTILTTHYHFDHAGGNVDLAAKLGGTDGLRVIGGNAKEYVPGATIPANPGSKLWLGATEIEILATGCHTRGHVAYHVHGPPAKHRSAAVSPAAAGGGGGGGGVAASGADAGVLAGGSGAGAAAVTRDFSGSGALFTGDTLFVGGVGKFFEGGAEEMYAILYGVLRTGLPPETPVFCGHEYTVENLKFALWLEPGNKHVEDKLAWALRRRADGHSTVPSLLVEERTYNPFMRVHVAAVKAAVAGAARDARGADMPEVPVLAAMRQLKNDKAHHGTATAASASGGGGGASGAAAREAVEGIVARTAAGSRSASFAAGALAGAAAAGAVGAGSRSASASFLASGASTSGGLAGAMAAAAAGALWTGTSTSGSTGSSTAGGRRTSGAPQAFAAADREHEDDDDDADASAGLLAGASGATAASDPHVGAAAGSSGDDIERGSA